MRRSRRPPRGWRPASERHAAAPRPDDERPGERIKPDPRDVDACEATSCQARSAQPSTPTASTIRRHRSNGRVSCVTQSCARNVSRNVLEMRPLPTAVVVAAVASRRRPSSSSPNSGPRSRSVRPRSRTSVECSCFRCTARAFAISSRARFWSAAPSSAPGGSLCSERWCSRSS